MKTLKLLVIVKVLPEPASSAAGRRMLQLIDLFQEAGWSVEMASVAKASPFSVDLNTLGIPFHEIELNSSSFDDFIAALRPNAVLFDRFMTEEQFGWRVTEHCPNALRILDTEDLHGLRAGREKAVKENRSFVPTDLFNATAFREIASIWRCDLSLIISEFEMNLLKGFFALRSSQLFYLPFLVPASALEQVKSSPAFSQRKNFISIGNFLHEPNLDAVKHLHKNIWPRIREKLPEAELNVYGAYTPEFITQLNSKSNGFIVKGRAEDVHEAMRESRLLLAPLRFGAGLKGKLMDAMLNGTPSITSTIGAEGMDGVGNWPGTITDDVDTFVNSAVTLYQNETEWTKASEQCLQTLLEFKKENFSTALQATLKHILENLHEHRAKNFTGAMLQQQQFNSSKYLSLWIEAKNKTNE